MMADRFIEPATVLSHFHLKPGEVVADFGAGTGFFLPLLARAVGHDGVVYACEVQKNLVEAIGELVRREHLDTVRPIWGDIELLQGTKIPTDSVDVGIIVNTLFQLEDKVSGLEEIARVLRPGGRLFVIDWSESFGGLGPQPNDVVTEALARSLVESLGYVFERSFPTGPHHYGLQFRAP